jgi:proteasome lid subunit RPN8/RPN11
VLTIGQAIRDAIIDHARRDHPYEACGFVAGPVGSDRAERFIPMINAENSETFYSLDSAEKLKVFREMDDRDEEPVVIYHSHTATEAYPSRTDIANADFATAHFVLVSTRDTDGLGEFQFRSYRIVDGTVTEEEIHVVPGGADAAAESGEAAG